MKKIIIALLAIALIVVATSTVKANRSYFVPVTSTAVATSTVTTLGTSVSTTLVVDSYQTAPTALSSATLLLQNVASSSASTLSIIPSYSQDGVDYFENNIAAATTTLSNNITVLNNYTLAGNTTSSTTRKAITIPTPTRYIKLTFTQTAGTSTVWAQVVPLREVTY
jgi:hypothetical protein